MGKNWQRIKSAWKYIVGLSTVFGIISFLIQISGWIDLWSLIILPAYTFFLTGIPIYIVVLLAITIVLVYYAIKYGIKIIPKFLPKVVRRKITILDLPYGRKIALLCGVPRTTDYLRIQYDHWISQSRVAVFGGYGFNDYMRRLENEGHLKYENGSWTVSQNALDYIRKYHGRNL